MRKERTANDAGVLMVSPRARNALGAGCRRVTGAAITITPEDENGIVIATTGGVATLRKDLPDGFRCKVVNDQAGQVLFAPQSGAALGNASDKFAMKGADAICDLLVKRNDDGASAQIALYGEVADYNDTTPWTMQTSGNVVFWHSVIWVEELGLFVACGNNTTHSVMTSPDGVTWSLQVTPSSSYFSVAWSPTLNLLVICGAKFATSPDGINWTERTHPVEITDSGGIIWSERLQKFVGVATDAGFGAFTSPDGIVWTAHATPDTGDSFWERIAESPELGIFVAVGDGGLGQDMMYSYDGVNWTIVSTPVGDGFFGVCWSPELQKFVASADYGTGLVSATSTDGINWTLHSSAVLNINVDIMWVKELGLFVIESATGADRVCISPDGENWQFLSSADDTKQWGSAGWSPSLGIAVMIAFGGFVETSNPL